MEYVNDGREEDRSSTIDKGATIIYESSSFEDFLLNELNTYSLGPILPYIGQKFHSYGQGSLLQVCAAITGFPFKNT